MLAQLAHPNIPKVTDYFTENNKHYIVMEFVPGETLEDHLVRQRAPCNEQEVRQWAGQLCDVLAYLHSQNPPIIFRDLKPGNIMLTPQGQIKLVDFGIARLFKPGKASDTQVVGTPGFASPEQYGRGQTDGRSDVYSLGVVLHHLLTLHDPTTTPFALPPVRQLQPSVSLPMEQAIAKATQTAAASRFRDVREMQRALDTGLAGPPPPYAPAPAGAGGKSRGSAGVAVAGPDPGRVGSGRGACRRHFHRRCAPDAHSHRADLAASADGHRATPSNANANRRVGAHYSASSGPRAAADRSASPADEDSHANPRLGGIPNGHHPSRGRLRHGYQDPVHHLSRSIPPVRGPGSTRVGAATAVGLLAQEPGRLLHLRQPRVRGRERRV